MIVIFLRICRRDRIPNDEIGRRREGTLFQNVGTKQLICYGHICRMGDERFWKKCAMESSLSSNREDWQSPGRNYIKSIECMRPTGWNMEWPYWVEVGQRTTLVDVLKLINNKSVGLQWSIKKDSTLIPTLKYYRLWRIPI